MLTDARFDQHLRWAPGGRLDHLFEQKVDDLRDSGQSQRLAVDAQQGAFTYAQLEERANRFARHLAGCGVRSGTAPGCCSTTRSTPTPARRITALCCLPTLLATPKDDLDGLRFLQVSGGACPQDLVYRWHRTGRCSLNVYGLTEATVSVTWTPWIPVDG